MRREVELTVSVGVASTKLVAKIASDLRKPDGLVVVAPGEEAAFLAPLPIARLWGVGGQTRAVLAEYGVRTIGDLAQPAAGRCSSGGSGSTAARSSSGPAASTRRRSAGTWPRSRSATSTRSTSTRATSTRSSGRSWRSPRPWRPRLRAGGVRASTVQVKLRDSAFATITRQRTLAEPTDLAEPIWKTALDLVRPELRGKKIRLVGVGVHGLGEPAQLGLFAPEDDRQRRATEAADDLRRRFGSRAVTRARLLDSTVRPGSRDPMQPLERRRVGRERPGEPPDG